MIYELAKKGMSIVIIDRLPFFGQQISKICFQEYGFTQEKVWITGELKNQGFKLLYTEMSNFEFTIKSTFSWSFSVKSMKNVATYLKLPIKVSDWERNDISVALKIEVLISTTERGADQHLV